MLYTAGVLLGILGTLLAQGIEPYIGSDTGGNLHINTTAHQDVFVNGVSFTQLVQAVEELSSEVAQLRRETSRDRVDALNPAASPIFESKGAVYISAKNGVYLSNNATFYVNETSTGWSPSTLECNVGDHVTFKWSSLNAVFETESDGTTPAANGLNSGNLTQGGEFTVLLLDARQYTFRATNGNHLKITVSANPAGLNPSSRRLQTGGADLRIIGWGRHYHPSLTCDYLQGAMYDSSSGCKCNEGELFWAFGYSPYWMAFCATV